MKLNHFLWLCQSGQVALAIPDWRLRRIGIIIVPSYFVDTLYKWIEKGIIPHYKPTGKKILFDRKKLSQWLESCEVC